MATLCSSLLEQILAPAPVRGRAVAAAAAPTARAKGAVASKSLVVRRVKEGLPASAFDLLCQAFEVARERMCQIVQIPARTLARRTVFKPEESERIVRLGRLFQRATEVLGSDVEARTWFRAPQSALGGVSPLDYADTEPGAREVEDLLGRLEHGVFA
jgi:putative toxin-antitoxin system antitoxin component (TIGR02293 family)